MNGIIKSHLELPDSEQIQLSLDDLKEFMEEKRARKKSIYNLVSPRARDTFAVLVNRTFWTLNIVFIMNFIICISHNYMSLISSITLLIMWIETIYICVKQEAKDFYWFSIGTTAYTTFSIGFFWKTAYTRHSLRDDGCLNANLTGAWILERCLLIRVNLCQFNFLNMLSYLISIVLAKWWMPFSKKQNKKAHNNLLAMLLSASADFFDLIEYANLPAITETIGMKSIYAVGCLSLVQFSFNLTATKNMNTKDQKGIFFVLEFLFCTEAWAIVLAQYLQDLPSLILRIYIITKCGVFVHNTISFFILKNLLQLVIETIRVHILFKEFKQLKADLIALKKNESEPTNQTLIKTPNKRMQVINNSKRDSTVSL